jgi:hypothetical protein
MYKHFQESVLSQNDIGVFVDESENHLLPTKLYDNINDFMDKFEKKEEAKKIKRKEMKQGLNKFYEEKTNE